MLHSSADVLLYARARIAFYFVGSLFCLKINIMVMVIVIFVSHTD